MNVSSKLSVETLEQRDCPSGFTQITTVDVANAIRGTSPVVDWQTGGIAFLSVNDGNSVSYKAWAGFQPTQAQPIDGGQDWPALAAALADPGTTLEPGWSITDPGQDGLDVPGSDATIPSLPWGTSGTVRLTEFQPNWLLSNGNPLLAVTAQSPGVPPEIFSGVWDVPNSALQSLVSHGFVLNGSDPSPASANIITGLYATLLARQPDAAGLDYWTAQYQGGMSLTSIKVAFCASPEFWDDAGSTNAGYVTLLYNRVLDRAPDNAGINFWLAELNQGDLTPAEVAQGFFCSLEYRDTNG